MKKSFLYLKALRYRFWVATVVAVVSIGLIKVSQTVNTQNTAIAPNFNFEWATNDVDKQKGLSGRDSLAQNSAMVFTSTSYKEVCIWMKEMRFPLTIVWFDADMKIEYVEPDVSPDRYPEAFCHKAKYVAEFNPVDFTKSGLRLGQRVKL